MAAMAAAPAKVEEVAVRMGVAAGTAVAEGTAGAAGAGQEVAWRALEGWAAVARAAGEERPGAAAATTEAQGKAMPRQRQYQGCTCHSRRHRSSTQQYCTRCGM